MPIQRTSYGSGITKRPLLVLRGESQNIGDTLQRAAETRTFEGFIREIEEEARLFFREAGNDPDNRGVLVFREDSLEDYYDSLLTWIGITRDAIARADGDWIARGGIQIGMMIRELQMKADWEKPALAGRKSYEGAKAGGNRRVKLLKRKRSERDLKLAKEFLEKRARSDGLSASALKEKIGKQHGLRRTASIRAVDRGLKFSSGVRGTTNK